MAEANFDITYNGPKTCSDFLRSKEQFKILAGPIGSGKSVACCIFMYMVGAQQPVQKDGKRRSRWAVIRNTKEQLKDTTLKTWMDWFEGAGVWRETERTFFLSLGDVEIEVLFRSLDNPKDVRKVLSMELTGAWINEAREISGDFVGPLIKRCGRYPSAKNGGSNWHGLICDTNFPEEDSYWWHAMEGVPLIENDPTSNIGATVFIQPPGTDPAAENVENLPEGYYDPIGMTKDSYENLVLCEYAKSLRGEPVYKEQFDAKYHVSSVPLKIDQQLPVIIGMDFGLTPSAVYMQVQRNGRLFILRETPAFNMGTKTFVAQKLRPACSTTFFGCATLVIGDPSGVNRAQSDESTCFQILHQEGFKAVPAITNDPAVRIKAFSDPLVEYPNGEPRVVIDPSCKMLIQGMRSKYKYRKVQNSEGDVRSIPDKNKWSHTMEAAQYGALFALGAMYRPDLITNKKASGAMFPGDNPGGTRSADSYAGY